MSRGKKDREEITNTEEVKETEVSDEMEKAEDSEKAEDDKKPEETKETATKHATTMPAYFKKVLKSMLITSIQNRNPCNQIQDNDELKPRTNPAYKRTPPL